MKNLTDAARKFVFEITNEDISKAQRYNKNYCAIARAVRATPGVIGVEVGAKTSRIRTSDGSVRRYMTPSQLALALTKFDKSGEWDLPPGVYKLNPPPPSERLEAIRDRVDNAGKPGKFRKRRSRNAKGKLYGKTLRNTPHKLNPRVIEFAKMRKESVA